MKHIWWGMLAAVLMLGAGLLVSTTASTQAVEAGPMIYLARSQFDPLAGEPILTGFSESLSEPIATSDVFLLQFAGPVRDEWLVGVRAAGIELLGYVPDFAFVARANGLSRAALQALPHVRWAGPYLPGYKIEESLDALAGDHRTISLSICLFPGERRDDVKRVVTNRGGVVNGVVINRELGDVVWATLPGSLVAELAQMPDVWWIEPDLPMELFNDRAREIMTVSSAQSSLGLLGTNLFGAGQIVAVADTGLDTGDANSLHMDVRGRLEAVQALSRPGDWSDPHGHGTHVVGSVLGNGIHSGANPGAHHYMTSFAGVAPESRLVFQSIGDVEGKLLGLPADLADLFSWAYARGARIHTNSWGGPTGGTSFHSTYGGYTTRSRQADFYMWNNPDMLLLFAVGNFGVDANADGVIDQNSVASPGTAKNVLSVGATENDRPPSSGFGGYTNYRWSAFGSVYPVNPIRDDYISNNPSGMAAFSSRGPTSDGRIKPELVAPGTDVISLRSRAAGAGTGWGAYNAYYNYNGGTSMATPLAAGSATLVRQYYMEQKGHSAPSAALLKATLINGALNISPGQYGSGAAREIPANIPNHVIGFGRVDVHNGLGLRPNASLLHWDDKVGIGTAANRTYYVTVTQAGGAGSRLAATLSWTDFPGAAGVGKTLVNDLDLRVIGPGGTTFWGNGIHKGDRTNNTERIVIPAPAAGTYQIVVSGYQVPQGLQPYALVVSGEYLMQGAVPTATATPTRTPTVVHTPSADMLDRLWLPAIVQAYPTPTPTATPTSTPTATPKPSGWVTITSEDFEGTFPKYGWELIDNSRVAGDYRWGKRDCKAYQGSYSGWSVGGGANGSQLACNSDYPNNVDSWIIFGPFSLEGATAAELRFRLWLNCETYNHEYAHGDMFFYGVSVDGVRFTGYASWGVWPYWRELVLDLGDASGVGDFLGESEVYVALNFETDAVVTEPHGAYVDDIVLRKCMSLSCPGLAAPAANEGLQPMDKTPRRE